MATLPLALRRTANTYPDQPAITFESITLTYKELDERVDQFAAELIERGVNKGDRLVIVAGNSDVFAYAVLGGLRAGAIVAPVNPKSAGAEIEHFVTDADVRSIIFDALCAPAVKAWAEAYPETAAKVNALSLGATEFGDDLLEAALQRPATPVELGLEEDDDCLIIYTSGTTGKPKGALFDHHRVLWVGVNTIGGVGLRIRDRYLIVAPLYHSAALNLLFFPALMMGAHQVIHSGFDPEAVLNEIDKTKINVFFGVPTMFAFMLRSPNLAKFDLSSLRVAFYGVAPMPGSVAERLFEVMPQTEIIQLCGQTEGGPGGIILLHEEVKAKPSASGRYATLNTEVRVVDAEGKDVRPGEVGEMIMRGESMMKEYWRRPDATAQTVIDGWVHTGDLAHVDEEGYITLVDRLKDMIITGGHNVYSAEVENALAAYPEITDIAVVSRPHPDYGETVVAVVTPAEGGNPTLEGLRAFAEPLLTHYKIPRELIIEDIPRNPSGKIQKHKLREKIARE